MFSRTIELTRQRPRPIIARFLHSLTPRYQALPLRPWTDLERRLVAVTILNTGIKSALR